MKASGVVFVVAFTTLLSAPGDLRSQSSEDNMSVDEARLQPGDAAPDFTLPDQKGQLVQLGGLRGRPVVLYFYPKDFTPGCTVEACDFRDNYAPLNKAGAIVLGVSPDAPESHAKFITEHALPFMLLSDTTREVMKSYGAWGLKKQYGMEYEGVIRSTVLIGADGRIVKVWPAVKVEGHAEKVLAEVQRLAVESKP